MVSRWVWVMRSVDRIETPSTKAFKIWIWRSCDRMFIKGSLTEAPEKSNIITGPDGLNPGALRGALRGCGLSMFEHGEPKKAERKSGGQDSNLRDVRAHIHPIVSRVAF